jgi:hypothetical protein
MLKAYSFYVGPIILRALATILSNYLLICKRHAWATITKKYSWKISRIITTLLGLKYQDMLLFYKNQIIHTSSLASLPLEKLLYLPPFNSSISFIVQVGNNSLVHKTFYIFISLWDFIVKEVYHLLFSNPQKVYLNPFYCHSDCYTITNLACDELIMKSCEIRSFICSYILHTNIMHWKHVRHTDKCVDEWTTNLWMNKCHTNFASSSKFMCQMCFQCMISMRDVYKLQMN